MILRDMFGQDVEVDPTPYGAALAERVADHLAAGKDIAYFHRDGCGKGLFYATGEFLYGSVHDGCLWDDHPDRFSSREAFVAWLSQQTDETLFNGGNQPITRARLEAELSEAGGQ